MTDTISNWNDSKLLVTHPAQFFGAIKGQGIHFRPFLIFLLVALIGGIILVAFGASLPSVDQSALPTGILSDVLSTLTLPVSPLVILAILLGILIVIFSVLFVLLSFIGAAITHIFVLLFGGKGGYTDTFNVFTYSALPSTILTFVPVVGLFSGFYSLYLQVVGLSEVHEMGRGKATLVVVIPIVLTIALFAYFLWLYLIPVIRQYSRPFIGPIG